MQKQVLLIEDEPHIAEAVRFILSRRGWAVSVESDGQRAPAQVRALRPDAVILDMMLPGRSGLEILADLRADPMFRNLPVLMLTARGQARDRDAAHKAGATAFLAKPFANAELLTVLEQIALPAVASCDSVPDHPAPPR
ncbi:two-component system response regulator [Thioclava sp. SK-1]|uniref:response regulator transcription factor n=1 Tax=Thioclava sp. SK-1 TaxID=1889770 RepID=UPI00082609DE|nr:response regulator [Thioclava sp. SK-1]OCX64521.1 two-component system response regulator [Thioclava sp. SK-1]